MAFVELILIISLLVFLFYKWSTLTFKTFEERGVPYDKPVALLGSNSSIILKNGSFHKLLIDFYARHKADKVSGFFNFRTPIFILTDPDLIKKITIKDFEYFPNHKPIFNIDHEPLAGSMLSFMVDQTWKDMRNTLSPVFTASKMRSMLELMNESFEECLKALYGRLGDSKACELELKEFFNKLSNDIIASTAFGLKVNSFENDKNEFYRVGLYISRLRGKIMLKVALSNLFPPLIKLLGITVFSKEQTDYFTRLVIDAMKYRKEHNIVRPDMIHLLMEAQEQSGHKLSELEIVAQCFIFFFAAFDNNSTFLCTTCHELADNPDIQQRLYEEVTEVHSKLGDSPMNYDTINSMKYLDMVVSESLRKWSVAILTDRLCSKDYKLTDDDGNLVFEFKAGDHIWIPIVGLHSDKEYFESPEIFDPERFSDENKSNIRPYTYLPFGAGPRICIGNRYALMQVKTMLYYLVLNFQIKKSSKTVKNLMDDLTGFQVNPRSGFWLRLEAREKISINPKNQA